MLQFKSIPKLKPQEQQDIERVKAEWVESLRGHRGADGKDGVDGIDGRNGKDGSNGVDGKNGTNGIDGKDGKDGLNGRDGKDGKDGRGIAGTRLDDKNLIIIYDDGFEENVGRVVGEDGRDGLDGMNGGVISGAGSQVGGGGLTDLQVIDEAEGGNSSGSYTSDKLTLITFADTDKYTNNTKTLNYTGDELTQTVNVFDYEDQTWTVTRDYTYLAGVWQTKSINIVKV